MRHLKFAFLLCLFPMIASAAPAAIVPIESFGIDRGKGNLVAIQPWVTSDDYATQATFEAKLDSYFRAAKKAGFFDQVSHKTIVVLPEYLSTWLVLVDEAASVFGAKTLNEASFQVVLHHPIEFGRAYLANVFHLKVKDALSATAFLMKSGAMARAYQRTFSNLSRRYGVTIVAGSILLPRAQVVDNQLHLEGHELFNTSFVFGDPGFLGKFGRIYPQAARKQFITTDEAKFTTAGSLAENQVFDTPAGKLGVLVCADSWYREPFEALKQQGVEMIAVPAFASQDNQESHRWTGKPFDPLPYCFDANDVGRITNDQAHLKCGLPGMFGFGGVRNAVEVFQRGHIFELGSDGRTNIIQGGELIRGPLVRSAAIQNSWIQ